MGYRLSRKETFIIERTKREGEKPASPGETGSKNSAWNIVKPYMFFAGLFLVIAMGWVIFLYLTK